ncbi:MAG: transposase [bacterium]|nr:transposase [bacterium]
MPIKRPQLANNEIYHLVLRGVGDSEIFRNDDDYWRAIFSIYEFNTTAPVEIRIQRQKRQRAKNGEQFSDRRKLLIDILVFCFMPNHIHLLVRQKIKNGITQFMRKFGAGYAYYFNKKYNRKGHFFQGRFRAVHIKSDGQLKVVFVYIHTNPISLIDFKWKKQGTVNIQRATDFLENYKWSSFMDYIGIQNFPSTTEREFLTDVLGGKKKCKEVVLEWIKGKKIDFRETELE